MPIEFYIVSGLVIFLLAVNLLILARVAMVATQARDVKVNGNYGDLLKKMSVGIADLLRESLPAEGASQSYRINSIVRMLEESGKGQQYARSSAESAQSEFKALREGQARIDQSIGTMQGTINQVAVAIAHTADSQAKIFNLIQSSGPVGQQDNSTKNIARDMVGRDVQTIPTVALIEAPPPALPTEPQAVEVKPGEEVVVKGVDPK